MRLIVNTNIDKDELEDINDLGDEDKPHPDNGILDDEGVADNKKSTRPFWSCST